MKYVGSELELFRNANRWKAYWSVLVLPYVRGAVLDVGSGLGVNADHLWNPNIHRYTFMEPDEALLKEVPAHLHLADPARTEMVHGTTASMAGRSFDTILYIDVLEHIADPVAELRRAMDLLAPSGHLIILVPAFPCLYSAFDKAIGHHRRYTRAMLRADLPGGPTEVQLRYLDSAGFALSAANRMLLRQDSPTAGQIRFWDECVIPLTRVTDRLVRHGFGRSLLGTWRK
ncbi:MAG: methyltransferase domain-containing protein [Flavobacteriales bacterium]|nr:methyltransferase domain-containing protein [Flavobacteriales bacterium]